MPLLPMVLSLAIPLALLIFCVGAIVYFLSPAFLIFLNIPVLLYSLGRGNFLADVKHYIELANRGDNVAASNWVDEMAGHATGDISVTPANDWKALHTQALKVISYRGFERTFAVVFWFVIAGALGALLYRLSSIYREHTAPDSAQAQLADKWLWLIELPAVRLMGLTWAFVGNFDSCPWRDSLLDTESSSMTILNNSLRGALSAPTDPYLKPEVADNIPNVEIVAADPVIGDENEADVLQESLAETIAERQESVLADNLQAELEADENAQEAVEDLMGVRLSPSAEPAYSFALVQSSVPLYSRSLIFWMGAVAFATLFI